MFYNHFPTHTRLSAPEHRRTLPHLFNGIQDEICSAIEASLQAIPGPNNQMTDAIQGLLFSPERQFTINLDEKDKESLKHTTKRIGEFRLDKDRYKAAIFSISYSCKSYNLSADNTVYKNSIVVVYSEHSGCFVVLNEASPKSDISCTSLTLQRYAVFPSPYAYDKLEPREVKVPIFGTIGPDPIRFDTKQVYPPNLLILDRSGYLYIYLSPTELDSYFLQSLTISQFTPLT